MKRPTLIAAVAAVIMSATGCRHTVTSGPIDGGDTLTCHAQLLTMVRTDSYILAEVGNPWNKGELLGRYILVDRDAALPDSLPQGTVIRTPLTNSTVYSSVHAAVIDRLGAIDGITGVADGSYFKMPAVTSRIADGTITDIGPAMSPSLEKIVALQPDAILTSPYQNAGHGLIDKTGAPIVECADYMETTPLGRAEWIKLIGALYGHYDEAAATYDTVVEEYDSLKAVAANVGNRPKVITESVADGVWYVPGGASYMATLLIDAGGDYPWRDDTSTGSLQLDFQAVYSKGRDADIWLIRTYGYDLTLDILAGQYTLNRNIKAFSNGGVYSSNTAETDLFEEFPFHPELLLREYINIIHPSLLPESDTLRYYRNVRQ